MTTLRSRLGAGLLIALAVNLALLGLHFWSHGGQTTTVRVENQGSTYNAFVDGGTIRYWDPKGGFEMDAPNAGAIQLQIPPGLPTLPSPSGIDSVEVRDSKGKLLFRDDFNALRSDIWTTTAGHFEVHDGVLEATDLEQSSVLALKDRGWDGDYSVSVKYRNGVWGAIGTHVSDQGSVFYSFEMVRDFPAYFESYRGDNRTVSIGIDNTAYRPAGDQTLRSLSSMATSFYPGVLVALAAACAIVLALSVLPRPRAVRAPAWLRRPWYDYAALLVCAVAFVATLAINRHYYSSLPHVPDEVAYLYQAKLFAHLRLTAPIPAVPEAFYFYTPPFLYEHGGHWASFYPFGHPLILAVGWLFGVVWLVPSLVGALTAGLVYLIGRRLFDARTGLAAAALLVVSPFFLMQSSAFMSHNTAALYILASLFFILKRDRPVLYGVIAGLLFGLLANTRPLTAAALIPPYGALIISYMAPRVHRRQAVYYALAFGAGAAFMGLAMLLYNWGLTGNPFDSAYASNDGATFGFVEGHTLEVGLKNQQAQMMSLLQVFGGWPRWAGIVLVLLPFLLGTRNRWDYFLAACALCAMGAYTLYKYSGLYEGPRYWYEAAPFLYLLAARGIEMAASTVAGLAAGVRRRVLRRGDATPNVLASRVVVYAAVIALCVWGTGNWVFGWDPGWSDLNGHLVPAQLADIEGIFGVDDRMDRLASTIAVDNALILVKPCGYFVSNNCYGSVFLRNSLHFNGDIVWANYIPEQNADIIAAYPGRKVYVASWDGGATLEPYTP